MGRCIAVLQECEGGRMNLDQAMDVLRTRAEINRAMCKDPESDFDQWRLHEATAIDVVLKELEDRQ